MIKISQAIRLESSFDSDFPHIPYPKMPPKKAGQRGLTQTQKYDLCVLQSRYPDMKLAAFAELPECPKREDGSQLALSSLSENMKGWREKVQKGKPSGMFSVKI